MANAIYPKAKQSFLKGEIDLVDDTKLCSKYNSIPLKKALSGIGTGGFNNFVSSVFADTYNSDKLLL